VAGGEQALHHIGLKKRNAARIERREIRGRVAALPASRISLRSIRAAGHNAATPVHSKVLATQPILLKTLAWAAEGASSVKQASDQWLQVLADSLTWMVAFIQTGWEWSSEQIARLSQAPWENWPLWRQILFVIVAASVVYVLFVAARQLWWAAMNVLSAVATFVGTLIVTLPTILLAGAIALGGLWVINNFDSLSSLRSLGAFPGGPAGHPESSKPPAKPDPAAPIDGND
jgi:hypothetical protein